MSLLSASLLFVYIIVIGVVWSAVLWWRKWRRMPPGPYGFPLLGYIPFFALSKSPIHMHLFRELHEKHGPVVCVSASVFRDLIFVSDSDMLRELFSKKELIPRPDPPILQVLSGGGGHIYGKGKRWQENRKFAVRFFREYLFKDTEKLNELTMESVEETVEIFNKNLNVPYDLGMIFNVSTIKMLWRVIVKKTSFPMLYEFIVGKLLQAVAKGEEIAFQNFLPACFTYLSPLCQENLACLIEMFDWLDRCILEDIEMDRKDGNLHSYVGQYLEQVSICKDDCFTERELVRNIRSLFAGGAETTATALKWAIKYLMDNPQIQRCCQQELDDVIGRERLPHIDDLPRLPYLNAFIEENHRMVAVIPIVLRQVSDDIYWRGYFIPKGSWCIGSITACQRNKKLFPDPDVFKPERFLDANSNFVKPTQGMASFGAGKRRCFGEHLAGIQLGLFLATLLQKFEFLRPSAMPPPQPEKWKKRVYNQVSYAPYFQVIIRKRDQFSENSE